MKNNNKGEDLRGEGNVKDAKIYKNLIVVAVLALTFSFIGSILSVKQHDKKVLADLEREELEMLEDSDLESVGPQNGIEDLKSDDNLDDSASSIAADLFFNGDNNELNAIIKNGQSTIVSFGTKSCIYCEELKPILSDLKASYGEDLDVLYVDIDDNIEVAENYPIHLTPSTVIFGKDGSPLPVDEEMFVKYGIDGFSKTQGGELEISAFFGLKQKDEFVKIIEDLLL